MKRNPREKVEQKERARRRSVFAQVSVLESEVALLALDPGLLPVKVDVHSLLPYNVNRAQVELARDE
jgi:hypothetical protein